MTSGVNFLLKNDPFILKHYSLIVTVIVYGVPGRSVFIWVIILLSGHNILKRKQAVYLLTYMFVSEPNALIACFFFFPVLHCLSQFYKL